MCDLIRNLSIPFIALALVAGACTPSGKGAFIIRGRVCDSDGNGTVKVTDRFGNVFSSNVKW